MSEERKHELLVRWMDGEFLEPEDQRELEVILEAEPELTDLQIGQESLSRDFEKAFKEKSDIPYGDFFQTKLEQAIRDANNPIEERKVVSEPVSWRSALRWWLAPLAAGSMAIAFLAGTRMSPVPTSTETIVKNIGLNFTDVDPVIYTPEGGVTASVVHDNIYGAEVILLEGLQPLDDSLDLMAKRPESTELTLPIEMVTAESSRDVL